jgi:hypothetical protein
MPRLKKDEDRLRSAAKWREDADKKKGVEGQ